VNPAIHIPDRKNYDPEAAGCRCDVCPMQGATVVPPEGPDDADAVLVAEGPGQWEERKLRPLVGPSGLVLDELLYRAGIRRDRLWITNTTLCRPDVPGETGKERYSMNRYLAWVRKANAKIRKDAKAAGKPAELIPSPVDCCRPRLLAEIAWFEEVARKRGQPNGAVIFATGGIALQALTGRQGITKYMGTPTGTRLEPIGLPVQRVETPELQDEEIPF
jgi:uracil-DNA glycosylase